MKVIVFDPPNAHAAAREWRDKYAEELSATPPEAVRMEIGRSLNGEYVQIMISDDYADRAPDA